MRDLQAGPAEWAVFGLAAPGHAPCFGPRCEATMSGRNEAHEIGRSGRGAPSPGRSDGMSLLAAVVLVAASARVESVYLTTADQRLAVRVALSGTPGMVAVHREGAAARVSIMDASLGLQFAGGRRFSWTPSDGFDPALLAASPAKLDRIEIAATDSEVSVLLHVPPEVAVDVRRDTRGLLLVFRTAARAPAGARRPGGAAAARRGRATAARRPRGRCGPGASVSPRRRATPIVPRPQPPVAPAPQPSPAARSPAAPGRRPRQTPISRSGSSRPLRRASHGGRLPSPSSTRSSSRPALRRVSPRPRRSSTPRSRARTRAPCSARSACAPRWTCATWTPTRSSRRRPSRRATSTWRSSRACWRSRPVGAGFLQPRVRAGVPRLRHLRPGEQQQPPARGRARAARGQPRDAARARPLPERRPRHARGGPGRRVLLRPRPLQPQRRRRGREHRGRAALERRAHGRGRPRPLPGGVELLRLRHALRLGGPGLRAHARTCARWRRTSTTASRAPTSGRRPSRPLTRARFALNGEILPLLTGQLAVGYRSQDAPNAGPRRPQLLGLHALGGAAARARARRHASRSTPTARRRFRRSRRTRSTSRPASRACWQVPLVAKFELRGGLGYQWNDYKTIAAEIGAPARGPHPRLVRGPEAARSPASSRSPPPTARKTAAPTSTPSTPTRTGSTCSSSGTSSARPRDDPSARRHPARRTPGAGRPGAGARSRIGWVPAT